MKSMLFLISVLISCTAEVCSQQSIIGTWQYETMYGVSQIVFNNDNTVLIDGEASGYSIRGEYIVINDLYGDFSYHYKFKDGKLILTFPDGSQAELKKAGQGDSVIQPQASAKPASPSAAGIKNLTGTWEYRSAEGNIVLSVISEKLLVYDGEQISYTLGDDAFYVSTDYGIVTYPFKLSGDDLTIAFPEGYQLTFKRTQQQTAVKSAGQKTTSQSGNLAQLYGKLCYYSGSSSTYSSYSRMEYIYFDGKGRFQFWKETSFSSDAGLAYGSDQDPNYVGSYSINGDIVTMTFDSGQTNILKVYMRQDNGRITELMYKQKLYATGLCE